MWVVFVECDRWMVELAQSCCPVWNPKSKSVNLRTKRYFNCKHSEEVALSFSVTFSLTHSNSFSLTDLYSFLFIFQFVFSFIPYFSPFFILISPSWWSLPLCFYRILPYFFIFSCNAFYKLCTASVLLMQQFVYLVNLLMKNIVLRSFLVAF